MANPFTPKTQKALTKLGGLIRAWSLGNDIPTAAVQVGDRFVISRAEFLALLDTDLGPEDYEIRDDIQTVELINRRPDCFTLVLPEASAVSDLNHGETRTVELPAIYEPVNPDDATTLDPAAGATRTVTLTTSNYEAFLDPYMAGYCCTQCH